MVFLAAVSGGADSMAMLAALSVLIPKERLFCLHVEHGLRRAEESLGDAGFVSDFCEKQGINYRVKSIPPGKIASFSRRKGTGIEAAARFFRRRALVKEAARLGDKTVILTAHTKDDALELVLMRILRGSGTAGLAIMPEKRGRFLRPLLSMSRTDVINYLTEKKISWREDSTNTDETFFRNKIRRRLIPLLNESFPLWKKGLAGMAETQSLASAFIRDEALYRICWEREAGVLVANREIFFSQPQIIREEALFRGIDLLLKGGNAVSMKRSVIRRFCAGSVNAADFGLLRVTQDKNKIVISSAHNNSSETGFSLLIKTPGFYNLNRIGIEVLPFSHKQEENGAFYAGLPLVFRRSFKDDFLVSKGRKITRRELAKNPVSAVDVYGIAAFIGGDGILFARDMPETHSGLIYLVNINCFT